ncbi:uncharacterized protein LOC129601396 [Paramacrobiotus metropolitanus]|uniref:uncharacterized protein LOC129601396 n=1 Tax=Paramacrobiotus metropolitanus TaxID=2943436 RepID=UPI00244639B9|nr:uncharacterized protein LOC129601396 [Paramacrobiotus metropolitanus]
MSARYFSWILRISTTILITAQNQEPSIAELYANDPTVAGSFYQSLILKEGQEQVIRCPIDYPHLAIDEACFQPDRRGRDKPWCYGPASVQDLLAYDCNGMRECTVYATKEQLGRPSGDTMEMVLVMSYHCREKGPKSVYRGGPSELCENLRESMYCQTKQVVRG